MSSQVTLALLVAVFAFGTAIVVGVIGWLVDRDASKRDAESKSK
jgi:hypothetical protein